MLNVNILLTFQAVQYSEQFGIAACGN
jgi:hypothetical protein